RRTSTRDDVRALVMQRSGDSKADAFARPRDDRDLVLELQVHDSSAGARPVQAFPRRHDICCRRAETADFEIRAGRSAAAWRNSCAMHASWRGHYPFELVG